MNISFEGKIVLVTGAGAGIGLATAQAFAANGATIVGVEIDAGRCETARQALGGKHVILQADATDEAQVARFIAEVTAKFGRLDVLVNNVGDYVRRAPAFADTTNEDIDWLYSTNLKHIFLVSRAALPLLRKAAPGSSIINISSIEGMRGQPRGVVYSAFKAAAINFTRSLALELGPEGIRVNAIAPETTESEQVKVAGTVPPEYAQHESRWFPLGRVGQPDDHAGCALYLASDMATWVTGVVINVDGGALAAGGWRRTHEDVWTNRPVTIAHGRR